jgi:hypothetical protein
MKKITRRLVKKKNIGYIQSKNGRGGTTFKQFPSRKLNG